ncbi:hypothetical protein ABS71_10735 [bacterium SCN 62-11]|nr:MAG: hypothetical protein ABS71_10735 [bacterium SCN 62-11]
MAGPARQPSAAPMRARVTPARAQPEMFVGRSEISTLSMAGVARDGAARWGSGLSRVRRWDEIFIPGA